MTNSDKYYSYLDRALIEKGTGPLFNGKAGDTFVLYAPIVAEYNFNNDDFDPENAEQFLTETYTVPQGVTAFRPFAFNDVYDIKTLVIPEGVVSLPAGVVLSDSVFQVYDHGTFTEYYFGISQISLPSTLKEINSELNWENALANESYPALTLGENFTGFVWPNGCNLKKSSITPSTLDKRRWSCPQPSRITPRRATATCILKT